MNKLGYNPDVLSCLANLSNDEVFTPPALANQMLDMLPQELFRSPDTKFLDPCAKSGVFLREIAKRLIEGLAEQMPDLQERIDHILHHQLYGIAITRLTSLMSRRSLYCSKDADGKYSISHFDNSDGNIRYKDLRHTWQNGKCTYCGASKEVFNRSVEQETHAYEFIHIDKPEKLYKNMKFDVIIGNPPYQLSSNEEGIQATPLYNKFVVQAKKLNPRFLIMIIPARWYAGGMGMNDFRHEMLNDNRIRYIHDFPKSRDCFSGVDIAGGVCYFLWEKDSCGICTIVNQIGDKITTSKRFLNEFPIFIRDNIGVGIIHKIFAIDKETLTELVLPISPYGLSTSVRGDKNKKKGSVTLYSSAGISYIDKTIISNKELIDKYKVAIGQLNPDRAGVNNASDGKMNVTTKVMIQRPNEVTTATYLVLGSFKTEKEALNYASYIKCKFSRFLIQLTLSSMHITRSNFQFVPLQDFTRPWTDEELYAKYGLTDEEIQFIESMIRPME